MTTADSAPWLPFGLLSLLAIAAGRAGTGGGILDVVDELAEETPVKIISDLLPKVGFTQTTSNQVTELVEVTSIYRFL